MSDGSTVWKGWLSKSQVLLFEKCPYAWYLSKILKLPEMERPELTDGREVHKILEWVYTIKERFEDENDLINVLRQNELFAEHRDQVINFARVISKISLSKPVYTEYKIFNSDLGIVGVIDRVDNINGEYVITEYKRRFSSLSFNDNVFELSLYAWLFEQEKQTKVNRGAIIYVNNGFLKEVNITDEMKKQAVMRVRRVRGEIIRRLANKHFEKREGAYCRYCQFAKYCDVGKRYLK